MASELMTNDIESRLGKKLKSYEHIYRNYRHSRIRFIFWYIFGFFILFLFVPWTQNIKSEGSVTTMRQEQRPQQINTILPGRIVKWWVKEGDYVKLGDTILQLAEIKDDYLQRNYL
jgi:multidrug efflux pump subunit AcrA (membrane-fusion protein)